MTLTADYQTFLATANPVLLAKDAQLHYVNTLSSFKTPDAIIKHLAAQSKSLKKKQETIISSIESIDAVCLDVETKIEFISGGGAYLPGLDDNLVADRIVTIPITHIARFDANGKIQHVRQQWDQASLLRAVEVIGSRGRNWPIKDGEDQIKLIKKSTEEVPGAADDVVKKMDPAAPKRLHPTNDPHTTLSLFAPREQMESESRESSVAPRGSRRPATRDWDELFPGGQPEGSPARSASPSKNDRIAPKFGGGKNFAPSRIFDSGKPEFGESGSPTKAENYVKPHPSKYSHFEFHDGHNDPAPTPSQPRPKTKHQSQWDFSDFTTPAKVKQRQHAQSNPQFSIGEEEDVPTMRKPSQPKARPDSELHFELQDDGQRPADNRPRHPRGPGHGSVSNSLYTDHTLADDGQFSNNKNEVFKDIKNVSQKDRSKDFAPHFAMEDDPNVEPTGGHGKEIKSNTTNTSLKDRNKDFGAQWEMTDSQPGLGERSAADMNRHVNSNRQQAVRTMEPNWQVSDVSPVGNKTHKPNQSGEWGPRGSSNGKENVGISVGGDGMGGRKDAGRSWGIGAEDDTPKPKPKKAVGAAYRSELWDY